MSRLLSELGLDEIEFEEPAPEAEESLDPGYEEQDGLSWLNGVLEARRRSTAS